VDVEADGPCNTVVGGDGCDNGGGMSYLTNIKSKCLIMREPTDGMGACSSTEYRRDAYSEAIKHKVRDATRADRMTERG
jgi:hypothetical protein